MFPVISSACLPPACRQEWLTVHHASCSFLSLAVLTPGSGASCRPSPPHLRPAASVLCVAVAAHTRHAVLQGREHENHMEGSVMLWAKPRNEASPGAVTVLQLRRPRVTADQTGLQGRRALETRLLCSPSL